jgi:hypothetical protein
MIEVYETAKELAIATNTELCLLQVKQLSAKMPVEEAKRRVLKKLNCLHKSHVVYRINKHLHDQKES